MAKTIKAQALAAAVEYELRHYSETVADAIKQAARDTADACVQDIQAKAPRHTGKYRRGWKTKTLFESEEDIRLVVYNQTAPQLTHLLEYGHAKQNGGRVEGSAHIAPAWQRAAKRLENKAKAAVKQRG
nr:MAG TPA: putative tail component [Bacteriophage sp.]